MKNGVEAGGSVWMMWLEADTQPKKLEWIEIFSNYHKHPETLAKTHIQRTQNTISSIT